MTCLSVDTRMYIAVRSRIFSVVLEVFCLILSTPIIKRYKNKAYAKARFHGKMRLVAVSFYRRTFAEVSESHGRALLAR